jgi:hypothetical protein
VSRAGWPDQDARHAGRADRDLQRIHFGTIERRRSRTDLFILVGFSLLGLSYGQAAGAMNANFEPKYRYTGAALTSDVAWLIGAGFAPLVALWLSSSLGPGYVSRYLYMDAPVCQAISW